MEYSNNQIKCILRIQEFLEISNTLSKIYIDFENKEYFIDTFAERGRIYRIYCASIYNLLDAIKKSKDLFGSCKKYNDFEDFINREYIAREDKYYDNVNYKSDFYKIMKTIRNQVNHYTRDDEDDNILFEINIDFQIVEELRLMINDIFNEIYNQVNKKKVKEIILNKPRIKYSMEKLSNKVNELKLMIPKSENRLDQIFKDDNERVIKLFDQLFDNSNLYDLSIGDSQAIKKFDSADKEMQKSFKKVEDYIKEKGTQLEKDAFSILKQYTTEIEKESIKDTNKKVEELKQKLAELKRKHEEK